LPLCRFRAFPQPAFLSRFAPSPRLCGNVQAGCEVASAGFAFGAARDGKRELPAGFRIQQAGGIRYAEARRLRSAGSTTFATQPTSRRALRLISGLTKQHAPAELVVA